jgi:hypothetical protein
MINASHQRSGIEEEMFCDEIHGVVRWNGIRCGKNTSQSACREDYEGIVLRATVLSVEPKESPQQVKTPVDS